MNGNTEISHREKIPTITLHATHQKREGFLTKGQPQTQTLYFHFMF